MIGEVKDRKNATCSTSSIALAAQAALLLDFVEQRRYLCSDQFAKTKMQARQ